MSNGNLWAQFQRALGHPTPQFLAEVVTVDADNTARVRLLPGGALIRVRGKASFTNEVGDRVIVQDGTIIEDGPAGDVVNVEV